MEGPQKKKRRMEAEEPTTYLNFEKLPEEIFTEILSFVPKFPGLIHLQAVCRYWRTVISKPSALWGGVLYFNAGGGNKFTTDVIVRYLQRCPEKALTSFYLGVLGNEETGVVQHDIVESEDGTRVLKGTGFKAGNLQLRQFIDLLADRMFNVKSLVLDIPFFAVPKSSAVRLAQNCINLKKLTLSCQYGDTEKSDTKVMAVEEDVSKFANFMDVIENLPSSLSNVTLTLNNTPRDHHYPIMFPSAAGETKRNSCHCVTGLCIPDESVDPEFIRLLNEYLPSLESVEVHTYWGGTDLSCFPADLKYLGFGERDMHCSDALVEVRNKWPNLVGLKLYGGIPNFTDLAALTSLESLFIECDCSRDDEGEQEVDAMWNALCNLKEISVPKGLFGENLSKFILTRCSPALEKLVLTEIVEPKHIAHLLDGTFENDDEDEDEGDDGDEGDEDEEEEEENEEEEEEEENEEKDEEEEEGEIEKERNKRAKELQKQLAEKKKKEKQQQRKGGDARSGVGGLKWIEIRYERDEHCFDPSSDVFDESEWNEFFAGALRLVEERQPAVRLVHVEPRARAVFIRK